jgi:hypothetical protein
MNPDRDLDALARDWLREGPAHPAQLREAVVEATLHQVHVTRQRRAGALRRLFAVNLPVPRVAIAAVALALLGALGLTLPYLSHTPGGYSPPSCPSPIPTAAAGESPADSPPPLDATFTSPLHGYSVEYPTCWTVTPATATWRVTDGSNWGSTVLDELRGADARFTAESQPLRPGQTREDWIAAYFGRGFDPAAVDGLPTVMVGDQVGVIRPGQWGVVASSGALFTGDLLYDAAVVVDGRGYDLALDGAITDPYVRAFFAGVTFDPGSAVDTAPSASATR